LPSPGAHPRPFQQPDQIKDSFQIIKKRVGQPEYPLVPDGVNIYCAVQIRALKKFSADQPPAGWYDKEERSRRYDFFSQVWQRDISVN